MASALLLGRAPLLPGESVRWSGRRGVRGANVSDLFVIGMAVPLALPLLLLVWFVAAQITGPGTLIFAAGFALVGCLVFGPMAWFGWKLTGTVMAGLFADMLGNLVVTDRRILVLSLGGRRIAREFAGGRLMAADVVALDATRRGQIALDLDGGGDEEADVIHLFGVPDAVAAAAAMQRLVRIR